MALPEYQGSNICPDPTGGDPTSIMLLLSQFYINDDDLSRAGRVVAGGRNALARPASLRIKRWASLRIKRWSDQP
jgi:hypothetical protein